MLAIHRAIQSYDHWSDSMSSLSAAKGAHTPQGVTKTTEQGVVEQLSPRVKLIDDFAAHFDVRQLNLTQASELVSGLMSRQLLDMEGTRLLQAQTLVEPEQMDLLAVSYQQWQEQEGYQAKKTWQELYVLMANLAAARPH